MSDECKLIAAVLDVSQCSRELQINNHQNIRGNRLPGQTRRIIRMVKVKQTCSLRVAVPCPRRKNWRRKRLRNAGPNRVP